MWRRSKPSTNNFLTKMAVDSQSAQPNENHRREASRQAEMRRAEERLNMKRNQIRKAQQTPTPSPSTSVISLRNKPPPVLPRNITKDLIMRARTGRSTNDGRQMMKILGDVIEDAITLARKLDTNANVKAMFAKGREERVTPDAVASYNENKNWQDLMAAVKTRYGWDFEWGGRWTTANGGSAKTYSTPFGTIKVMIHWRSIVHQHDVSFDLQAKYGNYRQTTYDPVIVIETKWHDIRLDRQFPLQIRRPHSEENEIKWRYKHSSPSDKFYYSIKNKQNRGNERFGFESEKIELGFLKATLAKNSDVVALSNWEMDGTRLNFSSNGLPKASMYHRHPPYSR